MSRFVIECPNCGKVAEAKTGFFARKKIDCSCGYTINVRTDKLTARKCPHCGNEVVFDQSQGAKAQCPYQYPGGAEQSCRVFVCTVRRPLADERSSQYICLPGL